MIEYREVPGADDGAEFTVVDGNDLSSRQRDGWTLVMLMPCQEHEDDQSDSPALSWLKSEERCPTPARERPLRWTTLYLLRKSRDEVVAQLRERLAEAKKWHKESAAAAGQLQQDLEQADQDRRIAQSELDNVKLQRSAVETRLAEVEATKARLERDLGKLREHFGSRAVKEALGGDE